MQNLNDVYYFSEVVTHGGFAAAGRALRVPKSKLSRRMAELEKRLEGPADRAHLAPFSYHRDRPVIL